MKESTCWVCWFCRSSSSVDPVINSHRLYKNKNKNQTTNREWTEEINMDSELQNVRRWSWHFFTCSVRELSKNPTPLAKMLTHLVTVFTAQRPPSDFTASFSGLELSDWLLWSLTPIRLLYFVISSGLESFRGHSSLCRLRAKVDKGISF